MGFIDAVKKLINKAFESKKKVVKISPKYKAGSYSATSPSLIKAGYKTAETIKNSTAFKPVSKVLHEVSRTASSVPNTSSVNSIIGVTPSRPFNLSNTRTTLDSHGRPVSVAGRAIQNGESIPLYFAKSARDLISEADEVQRSVGGSIGNRFFPNIKEDYIDHYMEEMEEYIAKGGEPSPAYFSFSNEFYNIVNGYYSPFFSDDPEKASRLSSEYMKDWFNDPLNFSIEKIYVTTDDGVVLTDRRCVKDTITRPEYMVDFEQYSDWYKKWVDPETGVVDVNAPKAPLELDPVSGKMVKTETYDRSRDAYLDLIWDIGIKTMQRDDQKAREASDDIKYTAGIRDDSIDSVGDVIRSSIATFIDESSKSDYNFKATANAIRTGFLNASESFNNYITKPISKGRFGKSSLNVLTGVGETVDMLGTSVRAIFSTLASPVVPEFSRVMPFTSSESFVYSGGKSKQKALMEHDADKLFSGAWTLEEKSKVIQDLKDSGLWDEYLIFRDEFDAASSKYTVGDAFSNALETFVDPSKTHHAASGNLFKDIAVELLLDPLFLPSMLFSGAAKATTKGVVKAASDSFYKSITASVASDFAKSKVANKLLRQDINHLSNVILNPNTKKITNTVISTDEKSRLADEAVKKLVKSGLVDSSEFASYKAKYIDALRLLDDDKSIKIINSMKRVDKSVNLVDGFLIKAAFLPVYAPVKTFLTTRKLIKRNSFIANKIRVAKTKAYESAKASLDKYMDIDNKTNIKDAISFFKDVDRLQGTPAGYSSREISKFVKNMRWQYDSVRAYVRNLDISDRVHSIIKLDDLVRSFEITGVHSFDDFQEFVNSLRDSISGNYVSFRNVLEDYDLLFSEYNYFKAMALKSKSLDNSLSYYSEINSLVAREDFAHFYRFLLASKAPDTDPELYDYFCNVFDYHFSDATNIRKSIDESYALSNTTAEISIQSATAKLKDYPEFLSVVTSIYNKLNSIVKYEDGRLTNPYASAKLNFFYDYLRAYKNLEDIPIVDLRDKLSYVLSDLKFILGKSPRRYHDTSDTEIYLSDFVETKFFHRGESGYEFFDDLDTQKVAYDFYNLDPGYVFKSSDITNKLKEAGAERLYYLTHKFDNYKLFDEDFTNPSVSFDYEEVYSTEVRHDGSLITVIDDIGSHPDYIDSSRQPYDEASINTHLEEVYDEERDYSDELRDPTTKEERNERAALRNAMKHSEIMIDGNVYNMYQIYKDMVTDYERKALPENLEFVNKLNALYHELDYAVSDSFADSVIPIKYSDSVFKRFNTIFSSDEVFKFFETLSEENPFNNFVNDPNGFLESLNEDFVLKDVIFDDVLDSCSYLRDARINYYAHRNFFNYLLESDFNYSDIEINLILNILYSYRGLGTSISFSKINSSNIMSNIYKSYESYSADFTPLTPSHFRKAISSNSEDVPFDINKYNKAVIRNSLINGDDLDSAALLHFMNLSDDTQPADVVMSLERDPDRKIISVSVMDVSGVVHYDDALSLSTSIGSCNSLRNCSVEDLSEVLEFLLNSRTNGRAPSIVINEPTQSAYLFNELSSLFKDYPEFVNVFTGYNIKNDFIKLKDLYPYSLYLDSNKAADLRNAIDVLVDYCADHGNDIFDFSKVVKHYNNLYHQISNVDLPVPKFLESSFKGYPEGLSMRALKSINPKYTDYDLAADRSFYHDILSNSKGYYNSSEGVRYDQDTPQVVKILPRKTYKNVTSDYESEPEIKLNNIINRLGSSDATYSEEYDDVFRAFNDRLIEDVGYQDMIFLNKFQSGTLGFNIGTLKRILIGRATESDTWYYYERIRPDIPDWLKSMCDYYVNNPDSMEELSLERYLDLMRDVDKAFESLRGVNFDKVLSPFLNLKNDPLYYSSIIAILFSDLLKDVKDYSSFISSEMSIDSTQVADVLLSITDFDSINSILTLAKTSPSSLRYLESLNNVFDTLISVGVPEEAFNDVFINNIIVKPIEDYFDNVCEYYADILNGKNEVFNEALKKYAYDVSDTRLLEENKYFVRKLEDTVAELSYIEDSLPLMHKSLGLKREDIEDFNFFAGKDILSEPLSEFNSNLFDSVQKKLTDAFSKIDTALDVSEVELTSRNISWEIESIKSTVVDCLADVLEAVETQKSVRRPLINSYYNFIEFIKEGGALAEKKYSDVLDGFETELSKASDITVVVPSSKPSLALYVPKQFNVIVETDSKPRRKMTHPFPKYEGFNSKSLNSFKNIDRTKAYSAQSVVDFFASYGGHPAVLAREVFVEDHKPFLKAYKNVADLYGLKNYLQNVFKRLDDLCVNYDEAVDPYKLYKLGKSDNADLSRAFRSLNNLTARHFLSILPKNSDSIPNLSGFETFKNLITKYIDPNVPKVVSDGFYANSKDLPIAGSKDVIRNDVELLRSIQISLFKGVDCYKYVLPNVDKYSHLVPTRLYDILKSLSITRDDIRLLPSEYKDKFMQDYDKLVYSVGEVLTEYIDNLEHLPYDSEILKAGKFTGANASDYDGSDFGFVANRLFNSVLCDIEDLYYNVHRTVRNDYIEKALLADDTHTALVDYVNSDIFEKQLREVNAVSVSLSKSNAVSVSCFSGKPYQDLSPIYNKYDIPYSVADTPDDFSSNVDEAIRNRLFEFTDDRLRLNVDIDPESITNFFNYKKLCKLVYPRVIKPGTSFYDQARRFSRFILDNDDLPFATAYKKYNYEIVSKSIERSNNIADTNSLAFLSLLKIDNLTDTELMYAAYWIHQNITLPYLDIDKSYSVSTRKFSRRDLDLLEFFRNTSIGQFPESKGYTHLDEDPKTFFESITRDNPNLLGTIAPEASLNCISSTASNRSKTLEAFPGDYETPRDFIYGSLESASRKLNDYFNNLSGAERISTIKKLDKVSEAFQNAKTISVLNFVTQSEDNLISHLLFHNKLLLIATDGDDIYKQYIEKLNSMLSNQELNILVYDYYDGFLSIGLDKNAIITCSDEFLKPSSVFEYLSDIGIRTFTSEAMTEAYHIDYIPLLDDLEIDDDVITNYVASSVSNLEYLSKGYVNGSSFVPYTFNRHKYLLGRCSKGFVDAASASDSIEQAFSHISNFDMNLIGNYDVLTTANLTVPDFSNCVARSYNEAVNNTSNLRMYIANYFDDNSATRYSDVLKGLTEEEQIEFFKLHPDQVVVYLNASDASDSGFVVKSIKVDSKVGIAAAEGSNSIIVPYDVYMDMCKYINSSEYSNQIFKMWSRIIFFLKVGHLCNPGTWMRNWVDATIKASFENGSIGENATYQLRGMRLLHEYNKIIRVARKQVSGGYFSLEFVKSHFDEFCAVSGANISLREFIDLESWLRSSLSGGESSMLKNALKYMRNNSDNPAFLKSQSDFVVGNDMRFIEDLSESELADLFEIVFNKFGVKSFGCIDNLEDFLELCKKFNSSGLSEAEMNSFTFCCQKLSEAVTLKQSHLKFSPVNIVDSICGAALAPMSKVEQIVRLGQYLALDDAGYTRSEIYKTIADTQFQYELKSSRIKHAELLITYANFEFNNLAFWVRSFENHPKEFYELLSVWRETAVDPWQQYYSDEDRYNNKGIANQMLNGNIPLGNEGLYLKVNPSALSALNWFLDMPSQLLNSTVPPVQLLGKDLFSVLGGFYSELLDDIDYRYNDKDAWEKAFSLVPIASTFDSKYLNHIKNQKWKQFDNPISYYLAAVLPDIFGVIRTYDDTDSGASSFDEFQKELEEQGKWYDANRDKVVDLSEKNDFGLNGDFTFAEKGAYGYLSKAEKARNQETFDRLCRNKWLYRHELWNGNLNKFTDFANSEFGIGVNFKFSPGGESGMDTDQWNAFCKAKLEYQDMKWDYNSSSFVKSSKWKPVGLNDPSLTSAERYKIFEERGFYYDFTDRCYKRLPEAMTEYAGYRGGWHYYNFRKFRRWVNYGNNYNRGDYGVSARIPYKPFGGSVVNMGGNKIFNNPFGSSKTLVQLRMAVSGEKSYMRFYENDFHMRHRVGNLNPHSVPKVFNPIIYYHISPK